MGEATCSAALKVEPSDCVPVLYSQIGCSEVSAVTTRGDEVKRWAGADASIDLLGEIDTAAEAELLAIIDGYAVCRTSLPYDGHNDVRALELDLSAKLELRHPDFNESFVLLMREGLKEAPSSAAIVSAGPENHRFHVTQAGLMFLEWISWPPCITV